ncbi:MAG TPA: hypothetical protein VFF29_02145 [Bacteroidota bacterium]|nr:hypothetical protein [Bacteroidota bacterium]
MARSKYTEQFCNYCNKKTKMEMIGGMEGVKEKIWFKCTRCHHMSLLDFLESTEQPKNLKIDATSATIYNPELSFKIGESIFHSEWNDVGTVMSKTKTSNGSQAIVVSFEKQGQRRLIENLKPEITSDIGHAY